MFSVMGLTRCYKNDSFFTFISYRATVVFLTPNADQVLGNFIIYYVNRKVARKSATSRENGGIDRFTMT